MKILSGHTNENNAFVVADYPYGFRLRTQIRYWIETNKKRGDRLCSQTLNPKTNLWNRPKKSTYSTVEVLFEQDNGHVTCRALHKGWDSIEKIEEFLTWANGYEFNEYQQTQIKLCKAIQKAQKYVKVSVVNSTNWTPEQQAEHEKKQIEAQKQLGKIVYHEYKKL